MKSFLARALPVFLLVMGVGISIGLVKTAPKAKRSPPPPSVPVVEVISIQRVNFRVSINTQGIIEPSTQSTLVAQVSGNIVEINPKFSSGGFFAKGDTLIRIDPTDYKIAITVAAADVARRNLELQEELARAEQAREEWTTLRKSQTPTALHLRQPQVISAKAALNAAKAKHEQARLNLKRTSILAPYSGRVLKRQVDLAQFVNVGTPLATVFSADRVEIRLPLTNEQQRFLVLPKSNQNALQTSQGSIVRLKASGSPAFLAEGKIVRTEAEVDRQSRQLFVVAEIIDPFKQIRGQAPLQIGQFVEVAIEGIELVSVFALPREVVRRRNEVQVVAADGLLYRRSLNVIWNDDQFIIADSGLQDGDRISRTIVPFATDGVRVKIAGESAEHSNRKSKER